MPNKNTALLRGTFAVMATLADVCAITLTAVIIGTLYHGIAYGISGMVENFLQLGLFIALIFTLIERDAPGICDHEVSVVFTGHGRRSLFVVEHRLHRCARERVSDKDQRRIVPRDVSFLLCLRIRRRFA